MTINIPGALLAVVLIWWAIVTLKLDNAFGLVVFVTGIVWALVSLGVHGGSFTTRRN